MKKIFILLMQTHTVPSKIIKVFTRYDYSHVGISLDKNCDIIYSFGRKRVDSVLDGGFVIEKKDGEFFKKFDQSICKIFELKVSEKKYKKLCLILKDMTDNQEIYGYDFVGLVMRFFKIPITFENKFVCSTFVAYLLDRSNIYKFKKELCFVEPKDYLKIPNFKEIYSGKYKLYNG